MTYDLTKRNRYYDKPHNKEYTFSASNLYYDFEDFLLPAARQHHANLHGCGVARGLEVSGASGAASISVQAGIAVDPAGRLIILSEAGKGYIAANPPPGNPSDEQPVPVPLVTSGYSGQAVYVTIQFAEILRTGEGSGGRWEQVPWIRLQPVSEVDSRSDEDLAELVVLAVAQIDQNGRVESLAHDTGSRLRRRPLGEQLGALELRRSNSVSGNVAEETAGAIEPLEPANGSGLCIRGDKVEVGKDGASASLTVFGRAEVKDTLHVVQTAALDQALSVGGNLDIGKSGAPASLTVFGQAEVIDTLHVAKAATLDQALSVGGNVDVGKSGAAANLTVFGQAEVKDTLHVAKTVALDQTLSVKGNLDVGKIDAPANLTVFGQADLARNLLVEGNVGIGENHPSVPLHIGKGSPGGQARVQLDNQNGQHAWINRWTDRLEILATDQIKFAIGNEGNDKLIIQSNGNLIVGGNIGIGTTTPGANARLAVVGGGITVGSTPWVGDAAIQVTSSFGGMDRLLQLSPTGASKPGLNLVASTDSSSNEQWWAWGVTAGNKFRIQPGTAFEGDAGLTIGPNSNVGIGTTGPKNTLDVKGAAVIGASYAGSNAAPANGLLVEGNVGIGKSGAPANLAVSGKAEVSDTLHVGKAVTLDQALIVGTNLTVKGKINNRTIAADGDNLDRHLANTGNPHAVTPELIGALSVSGGWISGGLGVGSDLLVSGTISSTKALLPDQEIGHASHALLNEWSVALRPSQAKLLFYNYEDSAKGNWAGIGVSSDGRIWIRAGWNNNLNDDAARTLVLIGPDIVISSRNWDHK